MQRQLIGQDRLAPTNGDGKLARLPVSRVRVPLGRPRSKGLVGQSLGDSLGSSLFAFDTSKNVQAFRATQQWRAVNTAYAATRRIAQDAGGVPLVVHKRGDPTGDAIESGDLWKLVVDEPNPLMDSFELLELTILHLLTAGDAFWLQDSLSPNFGAKPKELWPLPPHTVTPIPNRQTVIGGYMYNPGVLGRGQPLPREAIVHFRLPDVVDFMRGFSPFKPMDVALKTLLALHLWNKSYFENDATPGSVVFEVPPEIQLDDDEYERMRTQIREMWSGQTSAFEPIITEAGVKVSSYAHTHKEMGFPILEKASISEILKTLGVPPAIAGHFEGLNLAQVDMQERSYWRWTLLPLMRRIRSRINRTLAKRIAPDQQVDFDTSDVSPLQPDEDAILDRKTKRIAFGLDSPNEVLESEGRKGYGEDGDMHYISTSVKPVGAPPPLPFGALPPGATPPALPAGEEPEEEEEDDAEAAAKKFLVEVGDNLKTLNIEQRRETYFRDMHATQAAFFVAWKRIFRDVEKEIEEKVRANPPPELVAGDGRIRIQRSSRIVVVKEGVDVAGLRVQLPLPASAYLPEEDALVQRIEEILEPLYREAIRKFGQEAGSRIFDGFRFDGTTENVAVLVDRSRARLSVNTAQMLDDVGPVLEAGFQEGETVSVLMRRIRTGIETYSDPTKGPGNPFDALTPDLAPEERAKRIATRAERVARTEAAGSANQGRTEGFQQSGVKAHRWENSGLGNVRPAHQAAHGQTVKVGERFEVGGEYLLQPGDPDGSAWNIIQCNCTTEPVLEVAFA